MIRRTEKVGTRAGSPACACPYCMGAKMAAPAPTEETEDADHPVVSWLAAELGDWMMHGVGGDPTSVAQAIDDLIRARLATPKREETA